MSYPGINDGMIAILLHLHTHTHLQVDLVSP